MPLRTHERPNLPYEARPKRNSQRYQLLSARDQPPTAEMMDGDADYMIDSMDVLSQDIQNVQAGAIIGSDSPQNASKVLTTDGNTVGWTFVRTNNIENAAITKDKIAPSAVTSTRIQEGSVTNAKLAPLAVGIGNLKENSVGVRQIVNKNVTREKIADLAVSTLQLNNLSVTTEKLGTGSVTAPKMAPASVGRANIIDGAVSVSKLSDDVLFASIFPVGVVLPYAVPTTQHVAPPGWLVCNGRSVLRESYPALFEAIGTIYGSVDDAHFNLPDLRGRAIFGFVGQDAAGRITVRSRDPRSRGMAVGGYGGSEIHRLTTSEMPKHHHNYQDVSSRVRRYSAGADQKAFYAVVSKKTVAAGGDRPHNNMPPFILMNYIIKR